MRLGNEAGQVYARGSDPVADHPVPAVSEPISCEPAPDLAELLIAFRDREERIEAREMEMASRMQALSTADAEIQNRMDVLIKAEEALRATLALADTAAEDDLDETDEGLREYETQGCGSIV